MDSTVEILLQAGMNESDHGEIVVNHKLCYIAVQLNRKTKLETLIKRRKRRDNASCVEEMEKRINTQFSAAVQDKLQRLVKFVK